MAHRTPTAPFNTHPDIIVIGAGIIGLLIAKQFAQSGHTVLLLERGASGHEASLAGGGILSSLQPWKQSKAMSALIAWSQRRYSTISEALHQATGIDPEFESAGLLIVDEPLSQAQRDRLQSEHSSRHFSQYSAQAHFPSINIQSHADYIAHTAHIRNPKLLLSLKRWVADQPNIQLIEHQHVERFEVVGNRINAVQTQSERFQAGHYVMATGAWSSLLAEQFSLHLPIKPIRGQMLRLRPSHTPFSSILLHKETYLIPRRSGKVLVGSTLEDCGFDKSTTAAAYQQLLKNADQIMPGLASAELLDHWAGLRPGTSRDRPIIDRLPKIKNGYICAGHFRYGLTSAPASAALLHALVNDSAPPSGLRFEPYQLEHPPEHLSPEKEKGEITPAFFNEHL